MRSDRLLFLGKSERVQLTLRTGLVAAALFALVCCNTAELTPAGGGASGTPYGPPPVETGDASVGEDAAPAGDGGGTNLRIMSANISSGPSLSYGPEEGVRIFKGLAPDVVLIQEFKSGPTSATEVDTFVTSTFGAPFTYYREPAVEIPNGIISRYPITESGRWADPQVANRGFAYAKIAVPGAHPLWAVSVHLLTTNGNARAAEATALVAQVRALVPAGDYLVVGGDLNTSGRTETCITTLSEIVFTNGPFPADGSGNESTNAPRNAVYDWLIPSKGLALLQIPTVLGTTTFAAGVVFDSRVYNPIADVAPVQSTDSAAQNMQHMPVVRDFRLP
jgi:endonuclease/exonuclease/phosphatase family metal-dependent hydrolase